MQSYLNPTRRELTTATTATLLSVADVRNHLRLTTDEIDSTSAETMISGITKLIERYLNRPLMPQAWRYYFDRLPEINMPLRISTTPTRSITKVAYYDNDDTETIIASTKYRLFGINDNYPLEPTEIWPKKDGWNFGDETIDCQPYPIRVEAEVGWASDNIPVELKQAALMVAGDWWSQRRSGVSINLYHVPHGTRDLLCAYRLDTILVT